jgi:diacylglycerol kinase
MGTLSRIWDAYAQGLATQEEVEAVAVEYAVNDITAQLERYAQTAQDCGAHDLAYAYQHAALIITDYVADRER